MDPEFLVTLDGLALMDILDQTEFLVTLDGLVTLVRMDTLDQMELPGTQEHLVIVVLVYPDTLVLELLATAVPPALA